MLDEKSGSNRKGASVGLFLGGFFAAIALSAAAFSVWQLLAQPSAATSAAVHSLPAGTLAVSPSRSQTVNSLAALVAEETAKLGVKPHSIVSTTDKAMSAADALRRGDYQSAEAITQGVLAQSKLQSFSFHPFNRFIDHLSQGDDPKFLEGLNAWISHSPKAALPYLIRANYFEDTAWLVRGPDFAAAVTSQHMRGFEELLGRAEDDIRKSIALDPDIPLSYSLRLAVSADRGDPQQVDQVFLAGIARFPGYYDLYRARLHYLQPKWGGSTGAMYQFVHQYADAVPPSSPLKLLYMQLTANLLNAAWVECNTLKHEALTACIDGYMDRYVTKGLTDGVAQAFGLYKYSDPIQFSNALWPILGDMASTHGDSTTINTVLQLAGDAMGSDNQLIHDSVHNNYVLDDITAQVWSKLDNPVNVDQKFREALDDVDRTAFPNEEEKDAALAAVYEDMARVARNASQYAKVIAYHDAANTVAGLNHGGSQYLKCFAYFKLGDFQEAVDECTQLIDTHRDVSYAHYNRARAFEGLKNYDASLADFAPIAENGSENYIRWGAVIDMEHINALLGKYAAEIEIFNKYPFVFDASLQPPDDLAVAYNNRCFAYMKLGELTKALDDCSTSLKYGRLPDALQKQQQLQKLLSAQTT
jgi:tetratricopeptide (TPR) repeat protein